MTTAENLESIKHFVLFCHAFWLFEMEIKLSAICWTYRFDLKANIRFMSQNLVMGKMFSEWTSKNVVWSVPEHRLCCAKLCFNLLLTNFFLMLLMRIIIAFFSSIFRFKGRQLSGKKLLQIIFSLGVLWKRCWKKPKLLLLLKSCKFWKIQHPTQIRKKSDSNYIKHGIKFRWSDEKRDKKIPNNFRKS